MELYKKFYQELLLMPMFFIEIDKYGEYITKELYELYNCRYVRLVEVEMLLNAIEKNVSNEDAINIVCEYDDSAEQITIEIQEYKNNELIYVERLYIQK